MREFMTLSVPHMTMQRLLSLRILSLRIMFTMLRESMIYHQNQLLRLLMFAVLILLELTCKQSLGIKPPLKIFTYP